jgi:hypothetical protein
MYPALLSFASAKGVLGRKRNVVLGVDVLEDEGIRCAKKLVIVQGIGRGLHRDGGAGEGHSEGQPAGYRRQRLESGEQ